MSRQEWESEFFVFLQHQTERQNMTINELQKQAEQGNVDAQLELASLYDNGQGVEQSREKAVEWYTKAAEQGNATAQCILGSCYHDGLIVKQSYEKAVEWYTKAAEQGDATAQGILGDCYDSGQGVEQSYEKALRYYIMAALQGDIIAGLHISLIAEDNEDLVLKELENQKRKLDLDIITKEEYDKVKDLLKKYID